MESVESTLSSMGRALLEGVAQVSESGQPYPLQDFQWTPELATAIKQALGDIDALVKERDDLSVALAEETAKVVNAHRENARLREFRTEIIETFGDWDEGAINGVDAMNRIGEKIARLNRA